MSDSQFNNRIHCNVCFGEKRHTILHKTNKYYEQPEDEKSSGYFESTDYLLVECNGCEHISLVINTSSSGVPHESTLQYPPKSIKKEPKWLFELMMREMFINPYKYEFIQEIYVALRNNTPRLAVIGIRALLEQIMIEKVEDNGSFEKNIEKFEKEGFISRVQKEAILPVIEAGHASTHRGFKAEVNEIIYLIEVTENLIESIFINAEKTKTLSVPPRKHNKRLQSDAQARTLGERNAESPKSE